MIDPSAFEAHREFLFGLAYRLTGLASDAEDMVQEAWLRASRDPAPAGDPRASLATTVTRLALDRAKAARPLRERYVGPWLPEPVLTQPGADESVVHTESITLGFLVLLETLSPTERAVLLLRDVFEYEYDQVAATLGLTPTNCRQVLHRARLRVGVRRRRERPDPERQRRLVEQFTMSAAAGNLTALTQLLRADVTYTADGGGKVLTARRPVTGSEAVARLVLSLAGTGQALGTMTHPVEVNCEVGFLAWQDARLDSVWVFSADQERITAIRTIRNPAKLRFIARQVATSVL